jgi:hypothetical protein
MALGLYLESFTRARVPTRMSFMQPGFKVPKPTHFHTVTVFKCAYDSKKYRLHGTLDVLCRQAWVIRRKFFDQL